MVVWIGLDSSRYVTNLGKYTTLLKNMFRQFFCHLQFCFIQSTKLNSRCINQCWLAKTNNRNRTMYIVLFLLFVLANQHWFIHLEFNFVLCIKQNWRWQKNCRNMFFKSVVYFPKFVTYLLLSRPIHTTIKLTMEGSFNWKNVLYEKVNKNY